MPRLSTEPLARFATLEEEYHARGHRSLYTALRPDLAAYLDHANERALAAWRALATTRPEVAQCFLACVVEGRSQRQVARAYLSAAASV